MEKNLDNLWKTVLGEVETEISRANFLTLFKNTKLVSLEQNIATISTPSAIAIDLLQKRFSIIIKKFIDKQTKENNVIVFVAKNIPIVEQLKGPLFAEEINREAASKSNNFFLKKLSRVRPEFTFDTLAVSSSNQLAFVSAQHVVKNLGTSYNPLFIYGPVGVGKTHLMQAIANEVYKADADKKIIYITSEEFTNEVVEAIRGNDTARMKKKFRSVQLLLIDDIQFIAGKERVQEEVFHTFNILIDNGSQIVLSSDRPPDEIKKVENRLISRFSSGLTVDVGAPDFELRTAILLIKTRKYGVELPIEAAKIIAEKTTDVRGLEGALLRIITEAKTKNEEITSEFVESILAGRRNTEKDMRHPDDIIKKICDFYNIKTTQIKGPKRDARLVRARQIAMLILKKELGLTFVEIGNILGGRDHTTIMYGVEKMEGVLATPSMGRSNISVEIMGITKMLS